MDDNERYELAKTATKAFMDQVWSESPFLGTKVDDQRFKFGQALEELTAVHLSHLILGGDQWVELRQHPEGPDDGPVWQAIEESGIDPGYIGSHIHYTAHAKGVVSKVVAPSADPNHRGYTVVVWSRPDIGRD